MSALKISWGRIRLLRHEVIMLPERKAPFPPSPDLSLIHLLWYLNTHRPQLSVFLPVCLCLCLSLCLPACLPVGQFDCLSMPASVSLSACLSVSLVSVCVSVSVSACLSVCLSALPLACPFVRRLLITMSAKDD